MKLDDPQSPLCAAFAGKGFEIKDDIYYFSAPYSRENVHVLLSADTAKAPKTTVARDQLRVFISARLSETAIGVARRKCGTARSGGSVVHWLGKVA